MKLSHLWLLLPLFFMASCKCNTKMPPKSVRANSEGNISPMEILHLVFGNVDVKDSSAKWFTADTMVLNRFFGSVNYKDTFTTKAIQLSYVKAAGADEAWCVLYSYPANHTCQQCAPLLSLIRLRKDLKDTALYKLTDHQFTDCYGMFGKPADIKLVQWSDSIPGLQITWDQSEAGIQKTSTYYWLYNQMGRLKKALALEPSIEKSNEGKYDFVDSVWVSEKSWPYPNLKRTQKGSLPDGNGGLKNFNSENEWIYKQSEYVKVQ